MGEDRRDAVVVFYFLVLYWRVEILLTHLVLELVFIQLNFSQLISNDTARPRRYQLLQLVIRILKAKRVVRG